ncbi:MAG: hypothetical protein HY897_00420 [Deltaproteobacteria bacterium]|nr:hypothetical protein [Deltaproteobacteria bacterium]
MQINRLFFGDQQTLNGSILSPELVEGSKGRRTVTLTAPNGTALLR